MYNFKTGLMHNFKTGKAEQQLFDARILKLNRGFGIVALALQIHHLAQSKALMLDELTDTEASHSVRGTRGGSRSGGASGNS